MLFRGCCASLSPPGEDSAFSASQNVSSAGSTAPSALAGGCALLHNNPSLPVLVVCSSFECPSCDSLGLSAALRLGLLAGLRELFLHSPSSSWAFNSCALSTKIS